MIVLFYSQHCMRVLVIPYLSQHLVFIIHLNIIYSGQCAMTFPCYFNMYLSDDKTCHRRNTYLSMFFVCLLATCKYVLVKIQALCSLYLDYCCFVAVAYIFCNWFLCNLYVLRIFSPGLWQIYSFLNGALFWWAGTLQILLCYHSIN